jgi:hypothetical protein
MWYWVQLQVQSLFFSFLFFFVWKLSYNFILIFIISCFILVVSYISVHFCISFFGNRVHANTEGKKATLSSCFIFVCDFVVSYSMFQICMFVFNTVFKLDSISFAANKKKSNWCICFFVDCVFSFCVRVVRHGLSVCWYRQLVSRLLCYFFNCGPIAVVSRSVVCCIML